MASGNDWTYRSLVKPIPLSTSLGSVESQEPSKPCSYCAVIVPDRRKAINGKIKTSYERVDLYPDFPELKSSARAGCELCKLIRKTIRAQWTLRPMMESGVGSLREQDEWWGELFDAPWDRKVRLYSAGFTLQKVTNSPATSTKEDLEHNDQDSMIVSFNLHYGPATELTSPDGAALYAEICQILSFFAFDSQGEP
jgi:hypothetical protein